MPAQGDKVVQQADGGFAAAGETESAPFVTGQALLGLLAGRGAVPGADAASVRAARNLVSSQNPNGSWPGGCAHDTQSAWALLEALSAQTGQRVSA